MTVKAITIMFCSAAQTVPSNQLPHRTVDGGTPVLLDLVWVPEGSRRSLDVCGPVGRCTVAA